MFSKQLFFYRYNPLIYNVLHSFFKNHLTNVNISTNNFVNIYFVTNCISIPYKKCPSPIQ
jgi:hypothetical protein